MEPKQIDPNEGKRAPLPETVDQTKEAERLTREDRERFDAQGNKGDAAVAADESVDYESLTIPELKDLAHKRGVEISHDMRKDEIIAALEEG